MGAKLREAGWWWKGWNDSDADRTPCDHALTRAGAGRDHAGVGPTGCPYGRSESDLRSQTQSTQRTTGAQEVQRSTATQGSSQSALRASLRGMDYADQVQMLAPEGADGGADGSGEEATDPNKVVGDKDTPGVLYSNTSKTNLNKKSPWLDRLGFKLATHYTSSVTFTDLVLAGLNVKAPPATAGGGVTVPRGANTTDNREYDYIHTPEGSVVETGTTTFSIRGGEGVGAPVSLAFANNGGLNLARLARSAYELAVAKDCTVSDGKVDYKGQTFALTCKVQMGNEVDDEKAREYGYVGEFPQRWIDEKVLQTLEILCAAVTVAAGRGMTTQAQGGTNGMIHPDNRTADLFRTEYRERNEQGGLGIRSNTREIDPDNFSGNKTVQSWGTGEGQQAWMTDPDAITEAAQGRLSFTWAPGGDWRGHPTYITECPDFRAIIKKSFTGSSYTDAIVPVKGAMASICRALVAAPMDHELIDDQELKDRIAATNRAIIQKSFNKVADPARYAPAQKMDFDVKSRLETLRKPKADPETKPADTPVEDQTPNGEGLVLVRAWSDQQITK